VSDPIPTGCRPVDDLLGGGSSAGSSRRCTARQRPARRTSRSRRAVEVAAGGDRALYIDTEGLSIDRFEQMAAGRANRPDVDETVEEIASRLVISEAYDFDDQREAVRDAEELAEEIELIVLDSATGFYRLERAGDTEGGESLRKVAKQVTHLLSLARTRHRRRHHESSVHRSRQRSRPRARR